MSLLPDGAGLIEQLLLWVGLPIALVVVIMTALTVMDYLRYVMFAARAGQLAAVRISDHVARFGARSAAFRAFVQASYYGFFIATTFTYARLAETTIANDLDSGRLYDTGRVLAEVVDYQTWTPLSSNITLSAVLLVTVHLISRFVDLGLVAALPMLLIPIGVVSLLLAAVAIIPGICVLLLSLTKNEGYAVNMATLYAIWIVVLLGWTWSAAACFAKDGET